MTTTKTNKDPKDFDLSIFLAGVTPETRYVDVYPDRRLMANLARVRDQYRAAVTAEEGEVPRGLADVPRSVALRAEWEKLKKQAEKTVLTVEVHELLHSVRRSLTEDFLEARGVTEEQIAEDLPGLGAELDYFVLQRAIVYPHFDSAAQVRQFAEGIGDVQWSRILEAWTDTLTASTTLADIDITF